MFKRKINWYKISESVTALENQIALNHLKIIEIGGKSVCIGRNSKGIYAIKDKCPHQGYSFKGGWCNEDDKFVCPVHRYGFNVHDGYGAGNAAIVYPIEERSDGVYIGISYISLF